MAAENRQPYIEVLGMVIGTRPMGEYDRRVVLLTREKGKISAFAKGARRPNSQLLASTDLFCFGTFRIYAGRDSYTLVEASIDNYFPYFRTHFEEALMGQYFLEVMEYCTRENNDEAMLLLLTYQSLRALESEKYGTALVRSIFEIKTVVLEGEFALPANTDAYHPAAIQALKHIAASPVSRLYSFTLAEDAAKDLKNLAARYLDHCFGHRFKGAEVLDILN